MISGSGSFGAVEPADPVYAARIRAVYGQLPLTLGVTIVNSILVVIVMVRVVPAVRLWWWLGATVVLSGARFACWLWFYRTHPDPSQELRWPVLLTGGSLLAGTLWGAGAAAIWFPPAVLYQLFAALVIAGMCAGAATVHATHLPTVMAFVLPATLPLAARFFLNGGLLHAVAGIMTLIFAAAMCLASFRFQGWFMGTFAAQFSLSARTHELDCANARLKAEISGRLAAEAKLQQSQKMEAIGRLTAGVAHDFNNLLMAIRGAADMMENRLGPPREEAGPLNVIRQATERGSALTRQLLAFGRRQTLLPRPSNLNDVVSGMKNLLDTTVGRRGRLLLQLAPDLSCTLVDPEQIGHAILNIVMNARDAMPEGGDVTITTSNVEIAGNRVHAGLPLGRYVMMAISDTGTGMAKSVQDRAFDPFFTTKEIGQGTGLGLSQVHGLVHQSGGSAEIDSVPGKGTTVRIYLPAISPD